MRNIKFKCKNFKYTFKESGYKNIGHGNWIKEIYNQGRFHIKNRGQVWELHFDVYVDRKHTTFDMPITLSEEFKKIRRVDCTYVKPKPQKVKLNVICLSPRNWTYIIKKKKKKPEYWQGLGRQSINEIIGENKPQRNMWKTLINKINKVV